MQKPGHQATGNVPVIWSDELSFMLFPISGRVYVCRTAREAYNLECLIPTVKHGGGSVMVWAVILWYSVGPVITLHGRFTAREYMDRLGNQVHPMIRHFQTTMHFFKTAMPPFTQLELFSHGLS
jgi:hypothetical protein